MAAKIVILALLLFLASTRIGAQPAPKRDLPKFMGHAVTIVEPKLDADGFDAKGPASICVEGAPRQCYTAPKGIGRFPAATVAPFKKDIPALLFSAASGGVSGWEIHFALLRPGTGTRLEDLLGDVTVSDQSQHAFWNDTAISNAAICNCRLCLGPGGKSLRCAQVHDLRICFRAFSGN